MSLQSKATKATTSSSPGSGVLALILMRHGRRPRFNGLCRPRLILLQLLLHTIICLTMLSERALLLVVYWSKGADAAPSTSLWKASLFQVIKIKSCQVLLFTIFPTILQPGHDRCPEDSCASNHLSKVIRTRQHEKKARLIVWWKSHTNARSHERSFSGFR